MKISKKPPRLDKTNCTFCKDKKNCTDKCKLLDNYKKRRIREGNL